MKKTKLLISALSIASVGAMVAPIVTSCNKNTDNGISYQYFKDGQIAEVYKSQVAVKTAGEEFKKPTESLAVTTPATIAYVNDVKTNPKILADDVLVAINSLMTEAQYQNFTLGVTNISSDKTIRLIGDDVPLLSATIKIDIEHNKEGVENHKESASITFSNFLPLMSFDAEGKNPKVSLMGLNSFASLSLTSSSIGLSYNYADKDGNVITSFDVVADTQTEASGIVYLINKYSSSIDASITSAFSLLNMTGTSNSFTSSYFANQVQAI